MSRSVTQIALDSLEHGAKFPYDRPDDDENGAVSPAVDWAHAAARGVISDLSGRKTIKNSFDDIDENTRIDIVESLAAIIRAARQIDEVMK